MSDKKPNNNPNPQGHQIKLTDTIPGAEYSNAMQVQHTQDEFLLMFASVVGQSGRVVGKIVTTPGHIKRIAAALQDNISKYEEKFGTITEAQSPAKSEIGFQG